MELSTAITLIEKGLDRKPGQLWMDLGAGSGLFSRAIARVIGPGGKVIAVDKDLSALKRIPAANGQSAIEQIPADFLTMEFPAASLDGVMMANSLHFVENKITFLPRLLAALKPHGRLLLAEYDHDDKNPWVPYPLSYQSLKVLIPRLDPQLRVAKLHEVPSAYHTRPIYCALISH